MSRVAIVGWYAQGNLGDELILDAIAGHLRTKRPDVELTVASGAFPVTAAAQAQRSVPYTQALSRASPRRFLEAHDALIIGGGGLFHDRRRLAIGFVLWDRLLRLARRTRTPVYLSGVSIEPRVSSPLATSFARSLRRVEHIGVRDEASAAWLARRGVECDTFADVVFSLELGHGTGRRGGPGVLTARDVGVLDHLSAAGGPAARLAGAESLHVPFQAPTATHDGDVRSEPCVRWWEERNWQAGRDRAARSFRRAPWCVANRFHSLLLAATTGCPVLGVSYAGKMDSLALELGLESQAIGGGLRLLGRYDADEGALGPASARDIGKDRIERLRSEAVRGLDALADALP